MVNLSESCGIRVIVTKGSDSGEFKKGDKLVYSEFPLQVSKIISLEGHKNYDRFKENSMGMEFEIDQEFLKKKIKKLEIDIELLKRFEI